MSSNFNTSPEVPMSQDDDNFPYERNQEYNSTLNFLEGMDSGNGALLAIPSDIDEFSDTVIVERNEFPPDAHLFAEGDFIPPGFFARAHLDGFVRRFRKSEWTYEKRREAQQILPFLSLGPFSVLREHEFIRSQGFTLLLGIRNTQSALARLVSGEKAAKHLGIMHDTIDVLDSQELISAFPRAIRRINDHLAGDDASPSGTMTANQNTSTASPFGTMNANQHTSSTSTASSAAAPITKKVLLFCESGNGRSASVAIAYIMAMLNQDLKIATHMVRKHRFCLSIEDPLRRVLVAFQSILAAKRDVESARRMAVQTSPPSLAPPPMLPTLLAKKRSFYDRLDDEDAMDEDDVDMDADDDDLLERKPVAPFRDRVV